MARPMIKEAGMASLLLENPYYILLLSFHICFLVFYIFFTKVILLRQLPRNYIFFILLCLYLYNRIFTLVYSFDLNLK